MKIPHIIGHGLFLITTTCTKGYRTIGRNSSEGWKSQHSLCKSYDFQRLQCRANSYKLRNVKRKLCNECCKPNYVFQSTVEQRTGKEVNFIKNTSHFRSSWVSDFTEQKTESLLHTARFQHTGWLLNIDQYRKRPSELQALMKEWTGQIQNKCLHKSSTPHPFVIFLWGLL